MSRYLREIKQHCTELRAVLLDTQVMSAAEIAPYWPGGAENPDKDFGAWRYTLFNLARFSARAEARQEYRFGPNEQRSQFLQHVQSGEPLTLVLIHPVTIDGAEVKTLALHAKSWRTLLRMAVYGRIGTLLLGAMVPLEARFGDVAEAPDLLIEAHEWRARILALLVWAATTPGPGLPWNPQDERWPTPPAWLELLHDSDLLGVQEAFLQQHAQTLAALLPFVSASDKASDPLAGWETFFASYAIEKGIEAQTLMNDRAFAPFFTSLNLAAYAQRSRREEPNEPPPHRTVVG